MGSTPIEDEEGNLRDPAADAKAAQLLIRQARTDVGRASGRRPLVDFVKWVSRGRLKPSGWPVVPDLGTPWQDTISGNRPGWRQRRGLIDGHVAFEVDYRICRRCRVGWVEEPYTLPRYQSHGIASAALSALRDESPGLEWHTLGGHLARDFWRAIGAGVAGGYKQRGPCPHITVG